MFVDDLIVCGSASNSDAQNIARILRHFCNLSGQTPNWTKSAILFSKHTNSVTTSVINRLFPAAAMHTSYSPREK